MKNEEKLTFWKKLKISITDFERYQDLAAERVIKTIIYISTILLIFSLVVAGTYTYKISATISDISNYIKENIETITFKNNKLNIIPKSQEESIIIDNEDIGVMVIINTNLEEEQQINEAINEISLTDNGILMLKDKILIKHELLKEPYESYYKDIAEQYNINKIDKEEALALLSFDTIKPILATTFGILFIYFFIIIYVPTTLIDAIILSVFGYIVSSISRIRLKYSAIYNMAVYSLTLPIVLNLVYFIVNSFTGFTIKYFEIMYTTVATIYIAAAILMIRSDVIKKQMELTKIIEEQDRVRAELQRREEEQRQQEEKEKQKREEDKKRQQEQKDKKKKEGNIGKEPEGNNV